MFHDATGTQEGDDFDSGPLARELRNARKGCDCDDTGTPAECETRPALRIATSARAGVVAWPTGWRRPETRATLRRCQRCKCGVGLERGGPPEQEKLVNDTTST